LDEAGNGKKNGETVEGKVEVRAILRPPGKILQLCKRLLHKFPGNIRPNSKTACPLWRKSRPNWRGEEGRNEEVGEAGGEDSRKL
jgi:hypothetical protein